jgi:adenylosuccinate synthase
MKRVLLFCLPAMMLMIACNSSSDTKDTSEAKKDSTSYYDTTSGVSLAKEREMQTNIVIEAAKTTLDSIDAAYTYVRSSSKLMSLSLDDREQINFALQQMNDTRDLIILETQKEVLDQLQEKASSFKTMVASMHGRSAKLENITRSLSRLSDLIQKTTDVLVSAFSSGIIKPKLDALLGK